jgi:crossover junction endodeoxyribonuclease RuvC
VTRLVEAGVIRTRSEDPVSQRLLTIHRRLGEILDRLQPEDVAVEAIFHHRSSESALRLGQARGVALLAAAERGLPVAEYNPSTVKKSVAGFGRADKAQVARLVARLVGWDQPLAADASDAVAIALTHLASSPLRALLAPTRPTRR